MLPRISVVIITYNQENLIKRAIESVLKQSEFLYELVISDDCSIDKTWDIINQYKNSFPNIIKPYKNDFNLGIFKHIEKTWKYPTGDIIFYLSGDDEFCDGLFKNTIDFIAQNKIDYTNASFTIYSDYIAIKPNGKRKVVKNNLITKFNPVSLKIRKLISNRTTCISKKVLEKFQPVNEIGIFTDGLIDIQTQIYSEENYYLPYIGSVYYKNIGIGSRTSRLDGLNSFLTLTKEYRKLIDYWPCEDLIFLKYLEKRTNFQIHPNIYKYYILLSLYYKIKFKKYGLKYLIKETIFLIILFFKFLGFSKIAHV